MSCPACPDHDLVWYARCGVADRVGPFHTQLEAFEATVQLQGGHYPNAFVWCETVEAAAQRDLPWTDRNPLFAKNLKDCP